MIAGFWNTLTYPVIGLAPMDGVTDAPFREITARYGGPGIVFTEFTSAEGIRAGAIRLLDDFRYGEAERPVVAQLFGADPEAFYGGAVVASALGFDGIDINMGCPAKNVTQRGAGAALILDPERAVRIIDLTRKGTADWSDSHNLDDFCLTDELKAGIRERQAAQGVTPTGPLPVSVKTRVGYDSVVIEPWIRTLLGAGPVAITVHGRTLRQQYTGLADWNAIKAAATVARGSGTRILGNGDILSRAQALEYCDRYGVDGVLVGRAAQGNPWFFRNTVPDWNERLTVALAHARLFDSQFPPQAFVRMRKHLLDYIRGFDGAKELRIALMRASSLQEVERILLPFIH